MFTNKNEAMKNTEATAAINMIGAGTVITGDIQSKGDIRVDGTLKGSVNTSGKVVLSLKKSLIPFTSLKHATPTSISPGTATTVGNNPTSSGHSRAVIAA